MALDNAGFISELDITIPVVADPLVEGAGQIRAVKRAVQATFPNVNDVVNADAATMNAVFDNPNNRFVGEVTMFAGDVNALPSGWAICDGGIANGFTTPDLRSNFIKGYDNRTTQVVGDIGGVKEHTDITHMFTSDEHILTVSEIPDHTHDIDTGTDASTLDAAGYPLAKTDKAGTSTKAIASVGGGLGHKHNITTVVEATLDNQPEYVILAFICYVGVGV